MISLALALCNQSLPEDSSDGAVDIKTWLTSLKPGVEDALVATVLNGGVADTINYLPYMFPNAGIVQERETDRERQSHRETESDRERERETGKLSIKVIAFIST